MYQALEYLTHDFKRTLTQVGLIELVYRTVFNMVYYINDRKFFSEIRELVNEAGTDNTTEVFQKNLEIAYKLLEKHTPSFLNIFKIRRARKLSSQALEYRIRARGVKAMTDLKEML